MLQIIGRTTDSCPVGLNHARKPREPRVLPAHEIGWLNLKPHFPQPVKQGMVAPHGTTKPHPLGAFLSRVDEINALARTQNLELPSLAAEFKANGLSAISLSSSSNDDADDDLEAANIAEHHLNRVPYDPDPETLAPLLRRIEWERYVMACSSSTRIYAKAKADGKLSLATDNRTWTPDMLRAYAKCIKRLVHGRTADDLQNDRERARFYGAVVLALMTPEQQRTWRMRERRARAYLDVADTNVERADWVPVDPEPPNGGPSEFGLHWLDIDLEEDGHYEHRVLYEPTEYELWGDEDADIS